MRGEVCIGSASFLSLASLILLIFVHIGQINTSSVGKGVSMVKVNTSGYDDALTVITLDPIVGVHATNATAPLQARTGLRELYLFGLYSFCGYINETAGTCSNKTVGEQFRPYPILTSDMPVNYSVLTDGLFDTAFQSQQPTFRDSSYLGSSTKAAYYMILLGTICAGLAFLTGIIRHGMTFFISTAFALVGSLLLLIGAAIWTVVINKSDAINDVMVGSTPAPLGIVVSIGPALYMLWAAFAILLVSVVPYMLVCCTYRG